MEVKGIGIGGTKNIYISLEYTEEKLAKGDVNIHSNIPINFQWGVGIKKPINWGAWNFFLSSLKVQVLSQRRGKEGSKHPTEELLIFAS